MTKIDIENYIVYAQNKLAVKWNIYTTDLANGKCKQYPEDSLIFAIIGLEVAQTYEPDSTNSNYASNCINLTQLCAILAYVEKIIR